MSLLLAKPSRPTPQSLTAPPHRSRRCGRWEWRVNAQHRSKLAPPHPARGTFPKRPAASRPPAPPSASTTKWRRCGDGLFSMSVSSPFSTVPPRLVAASVSPVSVSPSLRAPGKGGVSAPLAPVGRVRRAGRARRPFGGCGCSRPRVEELELGLRGVLCSPRWGLCTGLLSGGLWVVAAAVLPSRRGFEYCLSRLLQFVGCFASTTLPVCRVGTKEPGYLNEGRLCCEHGRSCCCGPGASVTIRDWCPSRRC